MSDRSNWGSKLGFILAATGSAVGLGAHMEVPIWLVQMEEVLSYFLSFLWSLPWGVVLILAEFIIGRAGRGSVVTSFKRIAGPLWSTFRFHRRLLRLLNHDLLQQRRRLVLNLSIRNPSWEKPHLLIWLSWKRLSLTRSARLCLPLFIKPYSWLLPPAF